MGNGRVLPVLAVEDQHLLVNENGSIIQVQNNIQRQVTPGDYVNVENTLGQDKAVGVAREDDPSGQHARVEKVTDDYILVQTNSRSRILANPAEDVSPGMACCLRNWVNSTKYLKTVSLNSTIPPRPLREVNETDSSDLTPKTFLTKSMRISVGWTMSLRK